MLVTVLREVSANSTSLVLAHIALRRASNFDRALFNRLKLSLFDFTSRILTKSKMSCNLAVAYALSVQCESANRIFKIRDDKL